MTIKTLRGLGAISLVGLLVGCVSVTVGTDFRPGVNVSHYRTYAWISEDQPRTGDPRLDDNEFFDSRVRAAVERHLSAKGFRKSTSSPPDFLIDYHALVEYRVEVVEDDEYGYDTHGFLPGGTRVVEYEQGTLLIDVIDPETRRLVWRGWAQSDIDGVIGNPRRMEERINKVARLIIERFPPPSTSGG